MKNKAVKSNTFMMQIALGVIIALIVGGSSPWWWNKLVNNDSTSPPGITEDPNNVTPNPTEQTPTTYSDIAGASYEVECNDDKYGNAFSALLHFSTKESGKWRYTNSTSWNDNLFIEYLSAHRVLLTLGKEDQRQETWELEFSQGFRGVTGTYKFLQKNPTRWREYTVIGNRLE